MQSDVKNNRKYVFVCGLHRSGTSALGRTIGELEDATGLTTTSGYMEGQLHQDVYPIDSDLGGAGRFGFDSRAHLTETSELLTPENVARLRDSWHSYWDRSKTICVEKTPGNLLMTRFLQAAFPNSYFIVIRRHPIPVSMSTQSLRLPGMIWNVRATSLHRLFEHWLHCQEVFEGDKRYLRRLYELRYEDYIENPAKYNEEIAAFIGTRVLKEATARIKGARSQKYFERWRYLLRNSVFKGYYRYVARKYEPKFARYGYSLTSTLDGGGDEVSSDGGKYPSAIGDLYCLGADACAFFQRFGTLSPRLQLKALLPEFVLARIRRVRHRILLGKAKSDAISP